MKHGKSLFSVLLAAVSFSALFTLPGCAAAGSSLPVLVQKSITVTALTKKTIAIRNRGDYLFYAEITNNKNKDGKPYLLDYNTGVLADQANPSQEDFTIVGLRPTGGEKPVVTFYYTPNHDANQPEGKRKVLGRTTVTVAKNSAGPRFSPVTVGLNRMSRVTVPYPYQSLVNDRYKFQIENTAIAKGFDSFTSGKPLGSVNLAEKQPVYDKESVIFEGLKKGSTVVKAYLFGVYIGSFSLKVTEKRPALREKTATLNYYGSSGIDEAIRVVNPEGQGIFGQIENYDPHAVYTVTSSNPKSVSVIGGRGICTARAAGLGASTLTVSEKRAGKTTKLGTLRVKVVTGKMSDRAKANFDVYYEDEGVFVTNDGGNEELSVKNGTGYDAQPVLTARVLPGFKPSDYKVTYWSQNPKIARVGAHGRVVPVSRGTPYIYFKITFRDHSVFSQRFLVDVVQ